MSRLLLCVLVLAAAPAHGQVAFDAVSVKPAAQVDGLIEATRESTAGRVTYRNYTLKRLLAEAYQLTRYQVDGPPWIERERYDIVATKPKGTTAEQERQMMQRMLTERFHLVRHTDKRELAAYALLPGKDTSKLHAVKEGGDAPGCGSSGTMAEFAKMLASIVQKPVVDETGIAGRYYFVLAWSDRPVVRAESEGGPPPPPPPPSSSTVCPGWTGKWPSLEGSVFDAVKEQMGLRLERRGSTTVNILVLDHAERATAN